MRRLAVLLALAPAFGLADAGAQSPAAIDSIVFHDLLLKPKRAR